MYDENVIALQDSLNVDSNVIQLSNMVTESDKTKHMMSVISRANMLSSSDGDDLIKEVFGEIPEYYTSNAVQYCPVDSSRKYHEVSDFEIKEQRWFIDIYDSYKDNIDERGALVPGDYKNSKNILPKVAEYMERADLWPLIVIPYKNEDGDLKGVFVITSSIWNTWV